MSSNDIRSEVLEAVDAGLIGKDALIEMMVSWLSPDDIKEMLQANDIQLSFSDEEE